MLRQPLSQTVPTSSSSAQSHSRLPPPPPPRQLQGSLRGPSLASVLGVRQIHQSSTIDKFNIGDIVFILVHNQPTNMHTSSVFTYLDGRYVKLLYRYPNTNNWLVQNGTVRSVASETDMRLHFTADQASKLTSTELDRLYAERPSSEAVVYKDDEEASSVSTRASYASDLSSSALLAQQGAPSSEYMKTWISAGIGWGRYTGTEVSDIVDAFSDINSTELKKNIENNSILEVSKNGPEK